MSDTILSDPNDPTLRHYIVTLKNFDDLEQFYVDMEDPSNGNYTPDRAVMLMDRREVSRNTHYMLSDREAKRLRQDPRVESVQLHPEILGISNELFWAEQDSNVLVFDKTSTTSPAVACNWALYRCTLSNNIVINGRAWGDGGLGAQSTTLQLSPTGKNVDVVLVDYGVPDPSHPEYAVNANGTGGSRLQYVNWLANMGESYPSAPTTGLATDNWHAWHVAGTVAGNRQGWARDANIYVASLGVSQNIFDNVREWHLAKPVNPQTGRANPTIVNMSIGSSIAYSTPGSGTAGWNRNNLSRVFYRGQYYYPPFTDAQLIGFGMLPGKPWPVISSSWVADIQDAFADGIIVVAAAGNESWRIDSPSGLDWNNFATYYGYNFHISRGSTPGRIGTNDPSQPICVAALGSDSKETRAYFSNYGPGVDLFAPGTNINSSVPRKRGTADLRNSDFGLAYSQGTSMATPQVTGMVACMLETNPGWSQAQARSWITETAKNNQISEATSTGTVYQLAGSPNRIAYFSNSHQLQQPLTNVAIQVSNAVVMENSVSPIVFTFTRDSQLDNSLTVRYAIGGTASIGIDYTLNIFNDGNVVIPAGSSSVSVTAQPIVDSVVEGNETIVVQVLESDQYQTTNRNNAVATIADYVVVKPKLAIKCSPASVSESSRTGLIWTITRSPVTAQPLAVSFNVTGTAVYGTDYVSEEIKSNGINNLVMPSNAASVALVCRPIVDTANEPTETIVVTLQAADSYSIMNNPSATGSITNTYVPPPATKLTVTPSRLPESSVQSFVFTFGRTGQNTSPLNVYYTVSGTARLGIDYTGLSGSKGNVMIPAGKSMVQVPVTIINDAIKEPTETITVSLSSSIDYIVGSPGFATAFIADND